LAQARHSPPLAHNGLLFLPPMQLPSGFCGQGAGSAVRQMSSFFVQPCADPAGAHLNLPLRFVQFPVQQASGVVGSQVEPLG
jgi:hypothetical protein